MSTRMVMQAFMVASTFLHRSPFSQTLWTSSLSSSCSRLALWTTTCNTRPMVSCYNMNTPSLSTRTQTSGEVVAEKLSTTATKDEPALEVLSCNTWQRRANSHRERVLALTGGSVHHNRADPIFNFLFEYYHFKPRILLQWTPGFNVHLLEADPTSEGCPLPEKCWEPRAVGGGWYNPLDLGASRRQTIRRQREFLATTSARPPAFHCYGLHEWAMLYRPQGAQNDGRSMHQNLPLRVSREEINAMVEGRGGAMACTHFDAFRFFSPEARPLNGVQLTREDQMRQDQPGCVHANMDLFKWALQMWPLLPSEHLIDTLELAMACRVLDMKASPYDLTAYNKAPVPGRGGGTAGSFPEDSWDPTPVRIETDEGRREYQQAQLELYRRSMPIRRKLLRHMDRLLDACT